MKLHLKINMSNKNHTQFTIFEDGVKCGQVCMSTEGFGHFHMIVAAGCISTDEFKSSGKFYEED